MEIMIEAKRIILRQIFCLSGESEEHSADRLPEPK